MCITILYARKRVCETLIEAYIVGAYTHTRARARAHTSIIPNPGLLRAGESAFVADARMGIGLCEANVLPQSSIGIPMC